MELKSLFTIQRFLLLTTGLLCMIGVNVIQHSLTKYNIPFVGWILAVREYHHAHAAYSQSIGEALPTWQRYYATQTAYDHTQIGFLSTLAFFAVCLIVINRLRRRNGP